MKTQRRLINQTIRNILRYGKYSFFFLKQTARSHLQNDAVPVDILFGSQILVDSQKRIALFWTPKVGSLFAVRWFFEQKGLLNEALNYQRFYHGYKEFVHNYRDEIYRFSDGHRTSLASFLRNPESFTVIKIIRHPLKRAVSSYIHTIRFGFSDSKIQKYLARKISSKSRFSFREFVGYLESIDITKCNIHYRTQTHPLERSGQIRINHIVDIENSVEKISELERMLDLKQTNLARFSNSKHHTIRKNTDSFYGDKIDFFGWRNVLTPPAINFYDDDLVKRIGIIYAEDFERYGYKCSLSEIEI
jgi:hypothetical protein